jgi:hypothetical protein
MPDFIFLIHNTLIFISHDMRPVPIQLLFVFDEIHHECFPVIFSISWI